MSIFSKHQRGFINVDYEEFESETYAGVTVDYGGKVKRFASGNFNKDIARAKQWTKKNCKIYGQSSSVGDYYHDSGIMPYSEQGKYQHKISV